MPEALTLTPDRVLSLVLGGYVVVDPDGPAVLVPLTAPTRHSAPSCDLDPTGELGHQCRNSLGATFQPGQVCFTWAALRLAKERTPQPWHDFGGAAA